MTRIMTEIELQLCYRIKNALPRHYPFPHFYIENVFPDGFYDTLINHLPETDSYVRITDTGRVGDPDDSPYRNRYIIELTKDTPDHLNKAIQPFWRDFLNWFSTEDFALALLGHFKPLLEQRFGDRFGNLRFSSDIQLIRDFTSYGLGPHSDRPDKVAVLIFYLARDADQPTLGTSIYVPRDPGFVSEDGRHFFTDDFHLLATMPYKPNAALGFFKTANSFHGVEPITEPGVQRDLIQYSLTWRE